MGVRSNAHILEQVDRFLEGTELELVDVETVGSSRGLVVRIFVDKPGGVSIGDCARLSRAVGDHFEAEQTIPGRYVLEVSSPGVNRPLRKPEDFEKWTGETAVVSTYEKVDGRHRHRGVLAGFDRREEAVLMTGETGEAWAIPLGAIRKANLERDPWPAKAERGRRGGKKEK